MTLPLGLHAQSATRPTARSPAPTPTAAIGTQHGPPPVRSSRRSAPLGSTARRCRARSPGPIYIGEPRPGDRYRIDHHRRRFRHPRQARRLGHPGSADRPGSSLSFTDLPQTPLTGVQHALLRLRARPRSRRRPSAAPTRSKANSFPGTRACRTRRSTSSFTIDFRPERVSVPECDPRRSRPGFEAGSAEQHGRERPPPFTLELTRDDGDQNLTRHQRRRRRPASRRRCAAFPYCPEAAHRRRRRRRATPGGPRSPRRPARPPARSAPSSPAPAPGPARCYSPGKVYLAGPYKGAPLSLVVVIPAVSGPYDLGNVVVRAAIFVDPATAQVTRGLRPACRRSSAASRCGCARSDVDLDRPNFTLNPTNCDPFSVDSHDLRRRRGSRRPSEPLPGRQLRRPALRAQAQPEALNGGLNRRGHPAIHARLQRRARRSEHAAASRWRCRRASCSTTRTSTRSAPGSSSPPTPARRARCSATATATTPLLDDPLDGHRLPALLEQQAARPGRSTWRARSTSSWSAGSTRAKGGVCGPPSTAARRCPVDQFVLDLVGGAKGLLVNSESLCGKPKKATVNMTGQNGALVQTKVKLQGAMWFQESATQAPPEAPPSESEGGATRQWGPRGERTGE